MSATSSTLIASRHLNDVEPAAYLREVMRLLTTGPSARVLVLARCDRKQTREKPEALQLIADLWLTVHDAIDGSHDVAL